LAEETGLADKEIFATRLLAALGPHDRKVTETILGYPDESIGRLMTPKYVRVRPEWSVARALEQIDRADVDAQQLGQLVDLRREHLGQRRVARRLLDQPHHTVELRVALRVDVRRARRVVARHQNAYRG